MTATPPDVTPRKKPEPSPELDAARELVGLAREQGLALTGRTGCSRRLGRRRSNAPNDRFWFATADPASERCQDQEYQHRLNSAT
jgi:hypothetical protein